MRRDSLTRPLVTGLVLLAVFVLLDIGLFSWLIFRSLSQREVNSIVVETRQEAQQIADQIAADAELYGQDLLMAVTNTETRSFIDDDLARRETVLMVLIVDHEQRVVYRSAHLSRDGLAAEPMESGPPLEILPQAKSEGFSSETPYDVVEVPVGELGNIQIGLRREEVQRRLEALRTDLIRQAGLILALTVLLLISAYGVIFRLWRRARKLQDEVRESEQMAYVGTLASGLAHEIRSPLNSLNLNMQMLEEELAAPRDQPENRLLSITRSEISRLERLVSDFLSYARPRPPRIERTTAEALFGRVEEVLRARLRQDNVALELVDVSGEAVLEVDPEQLHQLLLNLLDNAIQATRKCAQPRIRLEAVRREKSVALAVADNGVGMTADEKEHALDVFYSQRKGGTGLGLAIASRIAKNHGSELRFESSPDRGTRVEVELAQAAPAQAEVKSPRYAASEPGPLVTRATSGH